MLLIVCGSWNNNTSARVCTHILSIIYCCTTLSSMPEARVNADFETPNMDVLVDLGHPLLNRVVDGFVKVGGVGALHAASQDATTVLLSGETNNKSFEHMAQRMGKEVVQWGDCKEGYYLGIEVPKDQPRSSNGFYGANIWPSEALVPGWRDTMERYHAEATMVGHKVASLVALALNLEEDFFRKPGMMDYPIAVLRLLHYSGEISIAEDGIFGAGAHSDWGLLTLLACDGTSGLQICKDKHAEPRIWENVQPIEGAFVVNLGDMLERWSNNIFRSTLHRVMTSGKERYSIAFFFDPNDECVVECLETCTSKDNPPKFPPIRSGEYLLSRYGETHAKLPASLLNFEAGNTESAHNCVQ